MDRTTAFFAITATAITFYWLGRWVGHQLRRPTDAEITDVSIELYGPDGKLKQRRGAGRAR